ncbi:MAG: 4'-phosphopantetheinyl transferase superfamily protein [Desulfobacterales bacterium]
MIHVGNDIVDLKTQGTKGRSTDVRFMCRVLTPDEKQAVLHAKDPDRYLWALWASKEAAYKAISKSFHSVTAAPKRYSVALATKPLSAISNALVHTPRGVVRLHLFFHETYIHCIGIYNSWQKLNNIAWGLARILPNSSGLGDLPPARQSCIVREMACRRIASHLKLKPKLINIKRHKRHLALGPPIVYIQGVKAAIDLSLSHHGRFGAYVFWATMAA